MQGRGSAFPQFSHSRNETYGCPGPQIHLQHTEASVSALASVSSPAQSEKFGMATKLLCGLSASLRGSWPFFAPIATETQEIGAASWARSFL